ncbi:NAD-dependent epimerase/dehydratase family protein [Albibacterium sp.]|uniref:NAD-dependent epimerase/dehydratase family protein n=1 Tax=Albibacterium sp. TaxID=2952885 RepID=UPI002C8C94D9|nr:NAD-dependent epimerase/dehydratase family protein [Albibacterium sp.]HUH18922.1 NAD-dependent epimerase/dehydratase family protein [Albibacterium sp.]
MEKALIIGINSFLGEAIYKQLKGSYDVTGIYNRNKENIPQEIKAIQVDEIDRLEGTDFKHIYLVSSFIPTGDKSIEDENLIHANLLLPAKVSKLFPQSRIVFCSSVSVYENSANTKDISTKQAPTPYSKYALSKLWGERSIENHSSYAIIRISSMYGVGMKKITFLPKIIENALSFGEIKLLGKGERLQNYIHVNDVASIAVKSAQQDDNFTIHAVSEQSYSNKEIAERIANITPCKLILTGEDTSKSFSYDSSSTKEKLGIINYKTIEEGIKEIIEWIKK